MKISYIEKDGVKLFSFHRHDFQQFNLGEFIDGGWDYTRIGGDVKVGSGEINDLIRDIREQFTWTSVLNKDNTTRNKPITKFLKDLDTDHIISILIYGIEKSLNQNKLNDKTQEATKLILLAELKYRNESSRQAKVI